MKNFLFAPCIAFIVLATACDRKNYVQESGFCTATPNGDSVQIPFGKTVRLFTGCKDDIRAGISGINDSRCPEGVQCIWAGKLSVTLTIGTLTIPLEKDKVVDTFYNGNRYTLNLVDALPRPAKDETRPQQTVTLKIMRAGRRAVGPDNAVPLSVDSARLQGSL